MVTMEGVPVAVDTDAPLMVMLALDVTRPELVKYHWIFCCTSDVVPPKEAIRASSRAAFVITCWSIKIRPKSTMPTRMTITIGASSPNSTKLVPDWVLRLRLAQKDLCCPRRSFFRMTQYLITVVASNWFGICTAAWSVPVTSDIIALNKFWTGELNW